MWSTLQKARLSLRNTGLARTAQRALQRSVPHWLFDFNSLIAIEIDFTTWDQPPTAAEWPHRWGDESDMDLITQGGFPAAEARAYFDQGARLALCEKDGKLVGYSWTLVDYCTVFGWIRVALQDNVYGAGAFIMPEFRGRGLHNEARRFAYPALRDLGYTRLLSFVEYFNRSSMRAGKSSNRRYVGRLTYVRLLGLVIYRLDGKWGAGFWSKRRPFELSFDMFDRDSFVLKHKDARSALDKDTGLDDKISG